MKITEHFDVPKDDLPAFLKEIAGKDFKIISNMAANSFHIITETYYTESEFNMLTLRTMINTMDSLTEEEKNALEFAIASIKTLQDMGVIK